MSFNQNNERLESETERPRRRDVVQHMLSLKRFMEVHARCCKRKFKWNSGRPNVEYQLITIYCWIFIENCDLITENDNL